MNQEEFLRDVFSPPHQKPPEPDCDPYDTPEYRAFVESMVPHCHCKESNRPCDGVLAGGICDEITDDDEQDWMAFDDTEDYE